ncbi:MAG: hypothetical protein KTR18_08480 [Acidiferrobacterales bacterium]|nr:hypothetical protein [Acidiferrobacterales bacterium]
MFHRRALLFFIVFVFGSASAYGADYNGNWLAVISPNAGNCNKDYTFNLTVKKSKVKGSVFANMGHHKVSGKIDSGGLAKMRISGKKRGKILAQFENNSAQGTWSVGACKGEFRADRES